MPFVILFALCWSGIVLLIDSSLADAGYKQFESRNFPSVTGTITHSEVQKFTSRKGTVSYTPVVNYEYKVDGKSFSGDRLIFGEDQPESATAIVNSHPVGSAAKVYYNLRNPNESLLYPGTQYLDFEPVLFLTGFNMVMIGFWTWIGGWFRLRLFKPTAGGVKIIQDGVTTRIHLPRWGAIWWALATTGGLGFAFTVIAGVCQRFYPPGLFVLPMILLVYLIGIGVYVWRRLKARSGDEDLIINESLATMELPLTFGRKERMTLGFSDIKSIWVQIVAQKGGRGRTSAFAPTLKVRSKPPQKLAEWSDHSKAVEFTVWLGEKTGILSRSTP